MMTVAEGNSHWFDSAERVYNIHSEAVGMNRS